MIDHLSFSSISLYLDCPEAWRRKYLAQEPTVVSPALVFGSAFHDTVEQHLITPTDLLQTWQEKWTARTEGQTIDWGLDTPEQHCAEGLRVLGEPKIQQAIAGMTVAHDEHGPCVERKITLNVPGVLVSVIGYIDLIAADHVPGDIKTSSRSWSADKAQGNLQSLFYLAALNQAGIHSHHWTFRHYIFVKTKAPQAQILEHRHQPGELFFLFKMIQGVWTAIEREVFPVNPTGWRCSPTWCDFYANCRGKYG